MPLPDEAKSRWGKLTHEFTKLSPGGPQDVLSSADIFSTPIDTAAPLSVFKQTVHPVSIPSRTVSNNLPVETNKFYGNMLLDDQTLPAWTQPYSVWFSKNSGYEGLAVHHVPASARVSGPDASTNPVQYFYGAVGVQSLVLGSTDFNSAVAIGLSNIRSMSADATIYSQSQGYLLAPLVQGMGFVTGVYFNLIPQLKSQVGIASVNGATSPRTGIKKYTIKLNNGITWSLYVTIPSGQSLSLALHDSNTIVGNQVVNGAVFQLVASGDSTFDKAAGMYPTRGTLSGSVSGTTGTYAINYSTAGASSGGTTAMFALPHHVQTFASSMSSAKTSVKLDTITKGSATLYLTNGFSFSLTVPSNISLAPYSAISGAKLNYSSAVKSSIRAAATAEVCGDPPSESNVNSMYGAGKILAKYAWILYVTHYVLQDSGLTNTLLPKLKRAIERFSTNCQILPLTYDTTWKGILSSGSSGDDYGNPYYNDHHFHYGYHIMAAAITAKVDADLGGSWLSSVKSWVNDLARDIANPTEEDRYFPAFRSFDWYHGHSWAKGLFSSGDGKDQESSSEDYNAWYSLKIWANVIGDSAMEARSNLQCGILKASCNNYFLLSDSNTVQPSSFIANKVAGILFENKVDHTTYFGTLEQYIQMIHAIPVTSFSSFVRDPIFTREEWNEKLKAIVDGVTDGWKGIIMLNVALFDPATAYNFFNRPSFTNAYLDGGQSKTWSLTYSGAFSGL